MRNFVINDFKNLRNVTESYIDISDKQMDLFERFYKILMEWNKKINLISRKEENILERHFLDSILFLPEIERLAISSQQSAISNFLDIGSGGGFPAVPVAIMKPSWQFTFCESIKKKANFLEHLIKELGFQNVEVSNARVGAIGKGGFETRPNKNKYDFITARAVAKLDELIKYSLPLLKKDGHLLAYKAKDIDEEIKDAEKLIEKNKLKLKIFSKEINGVERKLVVLRHCEER